MNRTPDAGIMPSLPCSTVQENHAMFECLQHPVWSILELVQRALLHVVNPSQDEDAFILSALNSLMYCDNEDENHRAVDDDSLLSQDPFSNEVAPSSSPYGAKVRILKLVFRVLRCIFEPNDYQKTDDGAVCITKNGLKYVSKQENNDEKLSVEEKLLLSSKLPCTEECPGCLWKT
eukprot:759797-Hanusia_phi.AAC.1